MALDHFNIKCSDGVGRDLPVTGSLNGVEFSNTLTLKGSVPTYPSGYLLPTGDNWGDLEDIPELQQVADPSTHNGVLILYTLWIAPNRQVTSNTEHGLFQYNTIVDVNTEGGYATYLLNGTKLNFRVESKGDNQGYTRMTTPIDGLRSGTTLEEEAVPMSCLYNFSDPWEGFGCNYSLYDNNKAADTAGARAGTITTAFTFLAGQSSVGGARNFMNHDGDMAVRIKDFWLFSGQNINYQEVGKVIHTYSKTPTAPLIRGFYD